MRFAYWGKEFNTFDHPYNTTALNERAVEIPIVTTFLGYRALIGVAGAGLEVGHVLGHYGFGQRGRRIVDLYEDGDGVENIDVFAVEGEFDWIVSVSTLEHVRWDCDPIDSGASADALDHLASLLTPTGRMIVTVPTGHHATFDGYLAEGAGTKRACTLRRAGGGWAQTAEPEFPLYGATTPWAEAVWIGEW